VPKEPSQAQLSMPFSCYDSAINFASINEPLLSVWLLEHKLQDINNPICHHAAQGTKASTAINAILLLQQCHKLCQCKWPFSQSVLYNRMPVVSRMSMPSKQLNNLAHFCLLAESDFGLRLRTSF
jgi:hypothetical protein